MKIIIVGGGFAGINLSKGLARKKGIEVILVDKNNYHFFPPLIYQVATSFIEASNISYPLRKMFQGKKNLRFHYGALRKIEQEQKRIITDDGQIAYDLLVLAMGAETNYNGLENVGKSALPMKTIDDALYLRNHLLVNMEKASKTLNQQERDKLLNIVIAGGGPTGVEVAGMIAEMGRKIVAKDYPELDRLAGNIYLVGSGEKLLGSMSVKAQQEAYEQLDRLNVRVKLGTAVKDYVNNKVVLSTGEEIHTYSLIWASGVIVNMVEGLPDVYTGRGKRIMVNEFNQVKGTDNIFAIGDICLQSTDKNYPNGHPQVAQVAIQQGRSLAKNIERRAANQSMKPFTYRNRGSMAIISKFKAVVDLPKGSYKGYFAWLTWLFIHIIPIAGFRNKVILAYNWFWSFLTNDPNLRLILKPKSNEQL
jgi:NADH dehydrogenase